MPDFQSRAGSNAFIRPFAPGGPRAVARMPRSLLKASVALDTPLSAAPAKDARKIMDHRAFSLDANGIYWILSITPYVQYPQVIPLTGGLLFLPWGTNEERGAVRICTVPTYLLQSYFQSRDEGLCQSGRNAPTQSRSIVTYPQSSRYAMH